MSFSESSEAATDAESGEGAADRRWVARTRGEGVIAVVAYVGRRVARAELEAPTSRGATKEHWHGRVSVP